MGALEKLKGAVPGAPVGRGNYVGITSSFRRRNGGREVKQLTQVSKK